MWEVEIYNKATNQQEVIYLHYESLELSLKLKDRALSNYSDMELNNNWVTILSTYID